MYVYSSTQNCIVCLLTYITTRELCNIVLPCDIFSSYIYICIFDHIKITFVVVIWLWCLWSKCQQIWVSCVHRVVPLLGLYPRDLSQVNNSKGWGIWEGFLHWHALGPITLYAKERYYVTPLQIFKVQNIWWWL